MNHLQILRCCFAFTLTVSILLSLRLIYVNHLKERLLVGKLKNIYYIDSYDDWRNFSYSFDAPTAEENLNTYVTSEIILDDVYYMKHQNADSSERLSMNHTNYFKHCIDDNIFTNIISQKYILEDLDYWAKGGIQCLKNWNKRQRKIKDYVKSYLLFEVENIKKISSSFSSIEPDQYFITSLQFRMNIYNDIQSYVYSYLSEDTNGFSNDKSTTIGKHWMFAVRRTAMMDINQESIAALFKYSSSRNIYIKYLKLSLL